MLEFDELRRRGYGDLTGFALRRIFLSVQCLQEALLKLLLLVELLRHDVDLFGHLLALFLPFCIFDAHLRSLRDNAILVCLHFLLKLCQVLFILLPELAHFFVVVDLFPCFLLLQVLNFDSHLIMLLLQFLVVLILLAQLLLVILQLLLRQNELLLNECIKLLELRELLIL